MSTQAKKIKLNILSVVLCQIITIAIGFVLPMLYVENFGSTVNGVLSTIKQIFTYLCLLEAGVGLATAQALFKPVAQGDRDSIDGILTATKQYYNRIGAIYSLAVVVIALIYGFFVNTGMSPVIVMTLVLLNGVPSVVTFLIEGKYRLLLEADGRQYVITNSQMLLQVISGFAKVAVLLLTNNLILMQASYCLIAVMQLLYITLYARRNYQWLDFHVAANTKAISQKNAVLVHQISAMVFNNTDILLLSFFMNFGTGSVYYIYNLFFSQIEIFISGLVKGFNFALGQLFSVDAEMFAKKFRVYETLYIAANFVVYTMMCLFLLPVIQIYTKNFTDADYYIPPLILLFVIAKLVSCCKLPASQVIEYSGRFDETRWHAIVEMIINITLSIVCILKWGICGALAGTIAALVFRYIVTVSFTSRKILKRSIMQSVSLLIGNGTLFAVIFLLFRTTHFCNMKFIPLCLQGLLHLLWIAPAYALVNAVIRPDVCKALLQFFKSKGRHS